MLQCGLLGLRWGLVHGYGLLVAVQHRLMELLPELFSHREVDFLVAVFCLKRAPAQSQIVWEEEEQRNE